MKNIKHNNKQIAFDSEGKGQAVIFLHGFGNDRSVWNEFKTDLLEEKFRVICIDLPGFGNSESLDDTSIENMAGAVNAVIDHLKLDQLILIGHSMGGYVSLAFAQKYPDKLIGLGMFHSHPYADTEEKKKGRDKGINFIRRQGHILFVKQLIPNLFAEKFVRSNTFLVDKLVYRASKYSSEAIINALEAMKARPDRSAVLTNIQIPVLFIIGQQDQAVPMKYSMDQTHLPETSSIHVLEKVGHMGMFEAKKQTQRIVRQFAEFCIQQQKE